MTPTPIRLDSTALPEATWPEATWPGATWDVPAKGTLHWQSLFRAAKPRPTT